MAIDYYASFPCPVRARLNDAELLAMEKARDRAETVLALMRKNPGHQAGKPESEWTFQIQVLGPGGGQEQTLCIADLLAESAPLERLACHCTHCEDNLNGGGFGCGGALHYPLAERTEAWLLACLPDDLASMRGRLLLHAIRHYGFDGAAIDAARSRRELYESAQPAVRSWRGLPWRKTRITSSQILHMMFAVGPLAPADARHIAHFLGFLDASGQIIDSPANQPAPEDDAGTAELKRFLALTARAGARGVGIFIDA